MKARILFINAINVENSTEFSLPPLGLGYLASSLRKEFGPDTIEFKIVDTNIEQAIGHFRPDIVGITSVSQNYNFAIRYAKIAKNHQLTVIVGGTHISALPSTLTKDMDVGVIGEGENTIVNLLYLYHNGGFTKRSLKDIKGIVFLDKDKIVLTPKRELIAPLDKIPMPARDLMKIENPTTMFTSRGCPYRCRFCASSCFWNRLRLFSARYVVDEIKYLFNNYKINHIGFWDDLFIADRERLKKILALLKKEGLWGKLSFGCAVRSNLVDEKLVKLLQEMNFNQVSMGLESASPPVLKYLKGDSIDVRDHTKAIRLLRRHKIEPAASFIIGSPKETKAEVLQTLDYIKQSQLRDFTTYVLTPFPGTPTWKYAQSKGLVSENMDWSTLDVEFHRNYQRAVILSETLAREELHQLFLKFSREKKRRLAVYALKNPLKIPGYILGAIKRGLPKIPSLTPWRYFFHKPQSLFARR